MTSSQSWSASADTVRIILPPAFLEALRAAVPRRRRGTVPFIIAAGLLFMLVVVGADRSTREFVGARWRGLHIHVARTVTASEQAPQANNAVGAPGTSVSPAAVETSVEVPMPVAAGALPAASGVERAAAKPKSAHARAPKKNQ